MSQVTAIINTLKAHLKAHKLRYADVAPALNLSEASVKRRFKNKAFDLAQLQSICQLMGLDISDLILLAKLGQAAALELTLAQEQEIAKDNQTLLIAVCVLNRWSFKEILDFYHFSEPELIQKLALLDRLKVIELLPQNRIKLLVAPNFRWRRGGPITQFFHRSIKAELFEADFNKTQNQLLILNGMLSPQASQVFQQKLEKLAHDFNNLSQEDAKLDVQQRSGVTLVLAMRDWHYGAFRKYIRAD